MSDEPVQLDIFRAAYADIPIRDQRDTMERPFFSLAKKPRRTPIEYSVNGVTVKVTPGEYGIATIWDADILIWLATQITEALDRGGEVSPVIRFHPHALLRGIRLRLPAGFRAPYYLTLKTAVDDLEVGRHGISFRIAPRDAP